MTPRAWPSIFALSLAVLMPAFGCADERPTSADVPPINVGDAEPETDPIPTSDPSNPALPQLLAIAGPADAKLGQILTVTLYTGFDPSEDIADVALVLAGTETWFKIEAKVEVAGRSSPGKWRIQVPVAIASDTALADRPLDFELALLNANGEAGGFETYTVMIGGADEVLSCPADADCSMRQCGADPLCATTCGTCSNGLTCDLDGQCEGVGDACPDAAACGDLECGSDPVCGVSCGSCSGGDTCVAGTCMAPTTGDCCTVHGGAACDDMTVAACVCDIDRYCCNSSWDQRCVDLATSDCGACTGNAVTAPAPH